MKAFWQLIMVALLQLPTLACATPLQGRFYGGAELGIPFDSDQTNDVSEKLVSALGGSASTTESGTVKLGRVFGGYKVMENLDVEVGAYQTGKSTLRFTGVMANTLPYSGVAHSSAYGVNYSALFRPNITTGWNQVFFRLGGHWSSLETTSTVVTSLGTSSSTTTNSGSGLVYGFGYDGAINKTTDWRLQLTRTNNVAGKPGLNTSVISFGVVKSF